MMRFQVVKGHWQGNTVVKEVETFEQAKQAKAGFVGEDGKQYFIKTVKSLPANVKRFA